MNKKYIFKTLTVKNLFSIKNMYLDIKNNIA